MKPWAPEVADSPYAPGDRSAEAQAWRSEAISAEANRRRLAGTFGAFSDDEMARARSVLGNAHDPAAEILGIESSPQPSVYVEAELWNRCVEAVQDMMRVATEAIEIWGAVAHESWVFMGRLGEQTEAPDLNRLRHGSASWCPKHGETRGGTCFRCVR